MSLDVLKLYRGENVVRQEPNDVDPNRWIDEGELTELPEVSLGERERGYMETGSYPESPEITAEPAIEIQVIPKDPEEKGYTRGYGRRYIIRTRREKPGWKRR